MPGAAIPNFDSVAIDCPEPATLARFYGDLLEWPVPEKEGDYVTLDPPGGGTAITFQRAPGHVAPTWPDPAVPQQMHLDLAVDDLDAAHDRAVALGARHLESTDKFRVYADPVGHLFCLCSW
jgi:catechol 2,3-dioxygenase-like lactoylglutathione lyase family enzyme